MKKICSAIKEISFFLQQTKFNIKLLIKKNNSIKICSYPLTLLQPLQISNKYNTISAENNKINNLHHNSSIIPQCQTL